MSIKTETWNIVDDLTTEEEIRLFVEASIEEARNDTDSRLLAHALATAAEARARLDAKNSAEPVQKAIFGEDPRLSDFEKIARLFGYHITLTPVA
ncbi:hypothetical protein FACS1894137_06300 [Spirochaetia bacterium]|nr:hypothetical protein FACS1894137_06300 [Spirochaetia bacterium]